MNMYKAMIPHSDVKRFYIPIKWGGRGLMRVAEVVSLAILGLDNYVMISHVLLMTAARRVDGDLETRYFVPVTITKKYCKKM